MLNDNQRLLKESSMFLSEKSKHRWLDGSGDNPLARFFNDLNEKIDPTPPLPVVSKEVLITEREDFEKYYLKAMNKYKIFKKHFSNKRREIIHDEMDSEHYYFRIVLGTLYYDDGMFPELEKENNDFWVDVFKYIELNVKYHTIDGHSEEDYEDYYLDSKYGLNISVS